MDIEAIFQRAKIIRAMPGFDGPQVWLTFYMVSSPDLLCIIADRLRLLGGINLEGEDGGILYPKLPVTNDPHNIIDCVRKVLEYASAYAVHVLSVDFDTKPDVFSSNFVELARFEQGDC